MRLTKDELDAIADALALWTAGGAEDAGHEEGPEFERLSAAADSAIDKIARERTRREQKAKR